MNIFELNRAFWDFAFNNPEKIRPNHCAIYYFALEHCNRLGWKEKFGFPTSMVLEATGIKSYSVYKKTFDELVSFGFFTVIEYSKNQYSSNIIALKENYKAPIKALDNAFIKHDSKQLESTEQSTGESTVSIDIPITNTQNTNTQVLMFERFWDLYDKKSDRSKCLIKFKKLKQAEIDKIFETLPNYIKSTPEVKFRKNPLTYLNGQCWNDEIIVAEQKKEFNILDHCKPTR